MSGEDSTRVRGARHSDSIGHSYSRHDALARMNIGERSPIHIEMAPDSPPYGRVTISPCRERVSCAPRIEKFIYTIILSNYSNIPIDA